MIYGNFQGLLIMYMFKRGSLTKKIYTKLVKEQMSKGLYLKSRNNQWANIKTALQNKNHPVTREKYGSFIAIDSVNDIITLLPRWREAIERIHADPTCDDPDCKKIKRKIESGKDNKLPQKKLTQSRAYLIVLYLKEITKEETAEKLIETAKTMVEDYNIIPKTREKNKVSQLGAQLHGNFFAKADRRGGHKYVSEGYIIENSEKKIYLTEAGQQFVKDTFSEEINMMRQQKDHLPSDSVIKFYNDYYKFEEEGIQESSTRTSEKESHDSDDEDTDDQPGFTSEMRIKVPPTPINYVSFKDSFTLLELEDPQYEFKDADENIENVSYSFKIHQDYDKNLKKLSTITEPIFTISYKRAGEALLNYKQSFFLGDEMDNKLVFLLIQEEDLEEYYQKWGGAGFIFIYIPKEQTQAFTSIPFKDFGIGQTRRCLQILAKHILGDINTKSASNIEHYWSFDDNITRCSAIKEGHEPKTKKDYEDVDVKDVMEKVIAMKDSFIEQDIPEIESGRNALIGLNRFMGTYLRKTKINEDVPIYGRGPGIGGGGVHVQKMLLINPGLCYKHKIFYKGIFDSKYGNTIEDSTRPDDINKGLYSQRKEDITFSSDLSKKMLNVYKIYNFQYYAVRGQSGGTHTELADNWNTFREKQYPKGNSYTVYGPDELNSDPDAEDSDDETDTDMSIDDDDDDAPSDPPPDPELTAKFKSYEGGLGLRNNIIRMYPNIKAMLIDRGYTPDSIPNTDFTNILEYKIKEFMDDEEDTTRILDFFVTNGETKDYVFFYKGSEKGFKINKVFFEKKVQKYFKEIESVKGLNINFDNFTFVLVKRKISKVEKELVDNFESSNPHIRICDYEKFLFNITAHKLVSKHSLYKKSYRTLLKKLMLDTPDKLPYILHADPISKHFNFRDGEIIEIVRDTLGKKITMYRVCKNFNYSHLAYKTNNKYVKGEKDGSIEDSGE